MLDVVFTQADIEDALSDLKITAANGPDGWFTHLLSKHQVFAQPIYQLWRVFAQPIYQLWKRSLDTGELPKGINLAYITPVFKGGAKCDPAHYR